MPGPDTFTICIVVSVVGILGLLAVVLFGFYLFRGSVWLRPPDHPWWHEILHLLGGSDSIRRAIPRHLADAHAEYLQRRNESWTTYGQIVIAVLVIVVLTILLLTKTISAEAGLPILSAIAGFAIGKGVAAGRMSSSGNDREIG